MYDASISSGVGGGGAAGTAPASENEAGGAFASTKTGEHRALSFVPDNSSTDQEVSERQRCSRDAEL